MRVSMVVISVLVSVGAVDCARILAVLPLPSKSHSIMNFAILRLLAQRGHEVVAFSAFPPLKPIPNVKHIELESSFKNLANNWTLEEFLDLCNIQYFFGFGVQGLWELMMEPCELVFQNEKVKVLLDSQEKFDLVYLEPTIGQESMLVFAHKFKAPIINSQGFGTWSLIDWVTGNSLSISHIPESLSFPYSNKMSFRERFTNFISTVVTLLFYHFDHLPKQQKIVDKYYKDPTMPPVKDMLKEISLTLSNSYSTIEYPRPYTPNIIPVGGVHLSSHMTPLPQNIKKFMDDGKEGVIFFSLGTIVPTHILPSEYIQAFVNAFRKIPKRVLWKIELESIPGLPQNVMLSKWVPQPTVLAHPNCVLFVTHGGLFSQIEAIHAGVPVVGIPFFADQKYNLRVYEHLGIGVKLDFPTITEDSVLKAINTILSNPGYKKNATQVSRIARDQPMSAADTVVFWVEYVLRHHGAPHLRPASTTLSWLELTLLDVFAALFAVVLIFLIILYLVLKKLFRLCFGSSSSHVTSIKKTN